MDWQSIIERRRYAGSSTGPVYDPNELIPFYISVDLSTYTGRRPMLIYSFTVTNTIYSYYYSTDGVYWSQLTNGSTYGSASTPAPSLLYFKGTGNANDFYTNVYVSVSTTSPISIGGNIMSLICGDNFVGQYTIPTGMGFKNGFFSGSSYFNYLTDASNLVLPATTLTESCYESLFNQCVQLTSAPALPAPTLANYCYKEMFYACTCLANITMLATDISATGCLTDWVKYVASSGTFTKSSAMTSLPSGDSGIPSGWIVVNS